MRLWSRLVALLLIVVVGPIAGATVAGRFLAQRQALAVSDATLRGESVAVRVALDAQTARVREALTGAVALRAVADAAAARSLRDLRSERGLDYLIVARGQRIVGASLRRSSFDGGVELSARVLAGSVGRLGLVTDRHVSLSGSANTVVWGGLYRDRTFLSSLFVPAAAVANGTVSAWRAPGTPVASVPATSVAFDSGAGTRGLCVCSGAPPSGIAVFAPVQAVGLLPPLRPASLLLIAIVLLVGVALVLILARIVSGPIRRLADDADASLRDELRMLRDELEEWDEIDLTDEAGAREDEVSRIGEAFRTLRSGLRHTTRQLGGSREELERARHRLSDQERLSLSDSLTGAWNRRYLEMTLSDAMQRARRMGHAFSVLMIDIDRFKRVNDRFGHRVGDEVLVELCRRISSALRAHLDVLVRYGGEEFVVLLPETGSAGARVAAHKIHHLVRSHPFASGDRSIDVTVSVGAASYPEDGPDADQILAAADSNMYRAKRSGRDRVVAGTPEDDRPPAQAPSRRTPRGSRNSSR